MILTFDAFSVILAALRSSFPFSDILGTMEKGTKACLTNSYKNTFLNETDVLHNGSSTQNGTEIFSYCDSSPLKYRSTKLGHLSSQISFMIYYVFEKKQRTGKKQIDLQGVP